MLYPFLKPPEDKVLGDAKIIHYTWGNFIKVGASSFGAFAIRFCSYENLFEQL